MIRSRRRSTCELVARGHLAFRPGAEGEPSIDVQRLLEYLVLSASLGKDGHVDDLAVRCLLQLEDNQVGEKRIRAIVEYCFKAHKRFVTAIRYLGEHPDEYTSTNVAAIVAEIDRIIAIAVALAQQPDETLEAWVDRICVALGIDGDDRVEVDEVAARIAIQVVEAADVGASSNFTQEFISSMSRLGEALTNRPGCVTVTTMHGAKGLDAEVVIVLQAEDELFPGADADEMETNELRRLMYVSLTRAKTRLFIAGAKAGGPRRTRGAEPYPTAP